jgi:hypothetical protein
MQRIHAPLPLRLPFTSDGQIYSGRKSYDTEVGIIDVESAVVCFRSSLTLNGSIDLLNGKNENMSHELCNPNSQYDHDQSIRPVGRFFIRKPFQEGARALHRQRYSRNRQSFPT